MSQPTIVPDQSGLTRSRRIVRNATIDSAAEIIAKLGSFALYVVMARRLGQSGFGSFIFALSLTGLLIYFADFGADSLVTREVARDRARVHTYLSNSTAVQALASIPLLIVAVGVGVLGGYSPPARAAILLVGIGVAAENLTGTRWAVMAAYERMELIGISLITQRILTSGVGIAVLLAGGGLVLVSIVYLVGALVGLAVAEWALRRFLIRPQRALDRSTWLALIKAGFPIGLATLVFTVLLQLDVVLVGLLKGGAHNDQVAYYGAATRVVAATQFLSWSFAAAVLPALARDHRLHRADAAASYELGLKLIVSILLPIALGFILLARPFVRLVYGANFGGAVTPLQVLGATTLLYGINYIVGTAFIARDRPNDFTRSLLLVCAQNVAFNLVLIPRYGARGAAAAAVVSGLLLVVLNMRQASRTIGRIRLRRTLSGPLLAGSGMSAVILATGSNLVSGALLGGVAYVLALIAFERLAFPIDVATVRGLLQRSPRSVTPSP